jgi:predicted glycosyltransferase
VKPRVVFWVQHLLGVGHVFRAARIAEGLVRGGFDTAIVMGGPPVPGVEPAGVRILQLPPVIAGPTGFSELVTDTGAPVDEAFRSRRRDQLLGLCSEFAPDILLTEAFPFGRRQMRFELLPLLEHAHASRPRPLIVCSVRDILQEKGKPARIAETMELLQTRYDHVVVHGDPRLVRLEATFPRAAELDGKVSYSGVVAAAKPPTFTESAFDVFVSAGGGAVGSRLLEVAILAKPLSALAQVRWVASTGPNLPRQDADRLRAVAARHDVTLVPFLPGLAAQLAKACLSISQAGYNTVADLLQAGCPAVLCPFAASGETEQTMRASVLAELGLAAMIPETDLSATQMAAAIAEALDQRSKPGFQINLDGASGTAQILQRLLRSRE